MLFGLLNLNKPRRMSSAAALTRLKHLVKPAKLGHAGTLDPLASGVLVVAIGSATRLIDYVQRMPKQYRATFALGRRSDSDDVETPVVELADPPTPDAAALQAAAARMIGEIQQRPPIFSAVKVAGQRAYTLARAGRSVELTARPITIHQIDIVEYSYPRLVLDIRCGSGTYVRAVGRDLAESLGTAAVMTDLVRTAIGPFRVEEACEPRQLDAANLAAHMLPALRAVDSLGAIELSPEEAEQLGRGLFVSLRRALPASAVCDSELAGVDERGELVAILRVRPDGSVAPYLNLRTAMT